MITFTASERYLFMVYVAYVIITLCVYIHAMEEIEEGDWLCYTKKDKKGYAYNSNTKEYAKVEKSDSKGFYITFYLHTEKYQEKWKKRYNSYQSQYNKILLESKQLPPHHNLN